jgi:hypothetical protein
MVGNPSVSRRIVAALEVVLSRRLAHILGKSVSSSIAALMSICFIAFEFESILVNALSHCFIITVNLSSFLSRISWRGLLLLLSVNLVIDIRTRIEADSASNPTHLDSPSSLESSQISLSANDLGKQRDRYSSFHHLTIE